MKDVRVLYGKPITELIYKRIRSVMEMSGDSHINRSTLTRKPMLSIFQVGDRKDSSNFIKAKENACKRLGFSFRLTHLPADTNLTVVSGMLQQESNNNLVDGIVLQLPLPDHLKEASNELIDQIPVLKDIDCLSSKNSINSFFEKEKKRNLPCVAMAVHLMLSYYDIPVKDKTIVIVGKGPLVGIPTAHLLSEKGARVELLDIRDKRVFNVIQLADIVISGYGTGEQLKGDCFKEGSVIIDVGVRVEMNEKGVKFVFGDVDTRSSLSHISSITPVPKGIGPVTVACLMQNLYNSYLTLHGSPIQKEAWINLLNNEKYI